MAAITLIRLMIQDNSLQIASKGHSRGTQPVDMLLPHGPTGHSLPMEGGARSLTGSHQAGLYQGDKGREGQRTCSASKRAPSPCNPLSSQPPARRHFQRAGWQRGNPAPLSAHGAPEALCKAKRVLGASTSLFPSALLTQICCRPSGA